MNSGHNDFARASGISRLVPPLVLAMAIILVLLIPLKIIGEGYLPQADALADAAKAISGKPWTDILLLRSDYMIDNHIGWHALLRHVWLMTNCNAETLVLFSTAILFILVGCSALPWLAWPEAWLITLVLVPGIQSSFMGRLMLGRPLLLSILALVTILFLWQTRSPSPPDKRSCLLMTVLIALAVLFHGVWYFWALPVAAFLLARQYRWCLALAACWFAGAILGAALTGHPWVYTIEALRQACNAMSLHATQRTLVTELRPTPGNLFGLLLLAGLLVLRQLARLPARPFSSNPAFWLALIGWVLGHEADRFWDDWGLPALMVLMAGDLQLFLQSRLQPHSLRRLALAAGLALTVYITTTNDVDSRWTNTLTAEYLTPDNPKLAGWLPDSGGILYEADMALFFDTFFKNPTAPWRYSVGYEPALMPPDDFATYQKILWNAEEPEAYQPWVRKMRPQDRLVLDARSSPASALPQLEWKYAVKNLWIGRLPSERKNPR
jgi:hypothetical protein